MFTAALYARVHFPLRKQAHETAGAARTRHSLRPHFFEGQYILSKPGRAAPRDRDGLFEILATLLRRPCERRDPYRVVLSIGKR